jgi:hypothetical protein
MKKYLINIGLAVKDSDIVISEIDATNAVTAAGLKVVGSPTVVPSDTEPTFVVQVQAPHENIATIIYALAVRLRQDAIVVFDLDTHIGELYGPRASDWSPFNPDYFILPSGERMSASMPQEGYCVLNSDITPDLRAGSIGRIVRHSGNIVTVKFGDTVCTLAASEIRALELTSLE